MSTQGFYGRPDFPADTFYFADLSLYLTLDRHERITEWKYECARGEQADLETLGASLIGQKLIHAWQALRSSSLNSSNNLLAVYTQLGRMLGHWPSHNHTQSKTLICRCFNVSLEQINAFLLKKPQASLQDLGRELRAGIGCGQCQREQQFVVQNFRDQNQIAINGQASPGGETPLSFLLLLQKLYESWSCDKKLNGDEFKFLGVQGYKVQAYWSDEHEMIADQFWRDSVNSLGINWQLQRSNFAAGPLS